MTEDSTQNSLTMQILQSSQLRWAILLLTFAFSIVAVVATTEGIFGPAGHIASVASAFATILLVSLTAQYAALTQRLVEENQKDREHRTEQQELERLREVNSLRRALHQEIRSVEGFDSVAESYYVSDSVIGIPSPTTIYETNTDKIGLLTEEEIDSIVEYYTRLKEVQDLMNLQRKMDTTVDMDPITEGFRITELFLTKVIRLVSFGHFGGTLPQDRVEIIQGELEKLWETQQTALSVLEENLEEES